MSRRVSLKKPNFNWITDLLPFATAQGAQRMTNPFRLRPGASESGIRDKFDHFLADFEESISHILLLWSVPI